MPPDLWQPTLHLRWVNSTTGTLREQMERLQQEFRHTTSGEREWRDIEVVDADET